MLTIRDHRNYNDMDGAAFNRIRSGYVEPVMIVRSILKWMFYDDPIHLLAGDTLDIKGDRYVMGEYVMFRSQSELDQFLKTAEIKNGMYYRRKTA